MSVSAPDSLPEFHADGPITGTADATTMKAIVQDAYGTAPEEVLRLAQVVRPAIADDEILVRVRAASVDRGTWHLMSGLAYPMRLVGFGFRAPKAPTRAAVSRGRSSPPART